MIPRSLTLRSTLVALVSVLVALVIVSVGVDVLVGRHLHGSLDRSLRQRAVAVAQLSATAPALLVSPGALDAPAGGTAGADPGARPARTNRGPLARARGSHPARGEDRAQRDRERSGPPRSIGARERNVTPVS